MFSTRFMTILVYFGNIFVRFAVQGATKCTHHEHLIGQDPYSDISRCMMGNSMAPLQVGKSREVDQSSHLQFPIAILVQPCTHDYRKWEGKLVDTITCNSSKQPTCDVIMSVVNE